MERKHIVKIAKETWRATCAACSSDPEEVNEDKIAFAESPRGGGA